MKQLLVTEACSSSGEKEHSSPLHGETNSPTGDPRARPPICWPAPRGRGRGRRRRLRLARAESSSISRTPTAYQAARWRSGRQLTIPTAGELPSPSKGIIYIASDYSPVHQQHSASVGPCLPPHSPAPPTLWTADTKHQTHPPCRDHYFLRHRSKHKHHAQRATSGLTKGKAIRVYNPTSQQWVRLPFLSNSILRSRRRPPSGGASIHDSRIELSSWTKRRHVGLASPAVAARRQEGQGQRCAASTMINFERTFADPVQPPASPFAAATPA